MVLCWDQCALPYILHYSALLCPVLTKIFIIKIVMSFIDILVSENPSLEFKITRIAHPKAKI